VPDIPETDPTAYRVTREQLERAQCRAEERGIHGDELREVMAMLCQKPRSHNGDDRYNDIRRERRAGA
jgi:hypothetical protein